MLKKDNIRLRTDQIEWLKQMAEKLKRPKAQFLRDVIDRAMKIDIL